MQRILSDFIKSMFYINTEIPILQVAEVRICSRVSHGKALPSILGHDTNVLTVFRPSRATRFASCATGIA